MHSVSGGRGLKSRTVNSAEKQGFRLPVMATQVMTSSSTVATSPPWVTPFQPSKAFGTRKGSSTVSPVR